MCKENNTNTLSHYHINTITHSLIHTFKMPAPARFQFSPFNFQFSQYSTSYSRVPSEPSSRMTKPTALYHLRVMLRCSGFSP